MELATDTATGGPEMRPDNFREQLFIARDETTSLPPEID